MSGPSGLAERHRPDVERLLARAVEEEVRRSGGRLDRDRLVQRARDTLDELVRPAQEEYEDRAKGWGDEVARQVERYVILQVVDQRWREHLDNMDYLREGVHLRAMAQKDPLVEYRHEGHLMFEELGQLIRSEVVSLLFHAEVQAEAAPAVFAASGRWSDVRDHEDLAGRARFVTARLAGRPAGRLAPGPASGLAD